MGPFYFHVKEHILPCQHIREYPGATLNDQEDILKLHVKQYKPKDPSQDQPGAITIIGAHANAFPKELYEPFWDELLNALRERGQAIKSIWIADVATQGKSAVLNEDKLGNDPSWNDHARDLLQMINHFRTEMPRPLVGIGHSMGGNQLTQLAYMHPRLLTSLVLIDPVIHGAMSSPKGVRPDHEFARASTFRRDLWASRTEAAVSFKKNKFYQTWDPRVLDLWMEHGLRDLPTLIYPTNSTDPNSHDAKGNPVTLTTTKAQEVHMFLRSNFQGKDADGNSVLDRRKNPDIDLSTTDTFPFYRPEPPATFKRLPHLRPAALYIFGDKSDISRPESRTQKLEVTGTGVGGSGGVKAGKVEAVVLEGVGHLIPMIAPKESGFHSADFLARDMKRWRKAEEKFKKEWESKSRVEKMTLSDEWKKTIGVDPKKKPLQKL